MVFSDINSDFHNNKRTNSSTKWHTNHNLSCEIHDGHIVKSGSKVFLLLCATPWRQPSRLPRPWDSPGKNTGVGCHFLLQLILTSLLYFSSRAPLSIRYNIHVCTHIYTYTYMFLICPQPLKCKLWKRKVCLICSWAVDWLMVDSDSWAAVS